MKKIFLSISTILLILGYSTEVLFAQAPSYKNFEWEVLRLGYGNLVDSDIQNGSITLGTELRYNISDFYSIGLGGDGIFSITNINDDDADLEVLENASLSIDRYFDNSSANRAFVGLSVGTYDSYRQFVRDGEDLDRFDEHSSLGIGIRAGYELKHLRITAQYQHTTSANALNGFTLTAGLTLWGGFKEPNT